VSLQRWAGVLGAAAGRLRDLNAIARGRALRRFLWNRPLGRAVWRGTGRWWR
jgi:hypothetical protein